MIGVVMEGDLSFKEGVKLRSLKKSLRKKKNESVQEESLAILDPRNH